MYDNIPQANENKIYFVANSTFYSDMMEDFRMAHSIIDERIVQFKTEDEVWNDIGDLDTRSFIIVFDETKPKTHMHYTIRSKSNHFQTDQQYSKDLHGIARKRSEYINDGFSALQHALNVAFVNKVTGNPESIYRLELERMPSPPDRPEPSYIDSLGFYIIIFSAFISISLIFTRIIEEKACGFREQLKNATRFSSLNNIALFIVNYVQMLVIFIVFVSITVMKGYWFSVNIFYPALLIGVFVFAIISFTFLVSAFFESSESSEIFTF